MFAQYLIVLTCEHLLNLSLIHISHYINKLRIEDFLQQIESGQYVNYQEAFFFVGFRSRSTALRNFRQLTGMIPSEYFQKKNIQINEGNVIHHY